ncbi:MAG: hypothetical protein GF320_13420 [Armatimonadia bacterium]|nr:hypothetical protein [Armatimonadia bacterium]
MGPSPISRPPDPSPTKARSTTSAARAAPSSSRRTPRSSSRPSSRGSEDGGVKVRGHMWIGSVLCLAALAGACVAQPEPIALTAAEAADLAVERSPELGTVEAEVAAAWARVRHAEAAQRLLVSAHLAGSYGDHGFMTMSSPPIGPPDNFMAPEGPYGRAALRLMYPLYTSGRLESAESAAEFEAAAKEEDLAERELEVRLTATLAYRQVLLAQALAEIADATVETLVERVRIAEARLHQGRVAEVDVLRQRAALSDARAAAAEARGSVEQALIDFHAILALDQETPTSLLEPLEIPVVDGDTGSLLDLALESRPVIVAVDHRISAAAERAAEAEGADDLQVYAFGGAVADVMRNGRLDPGYLVGLSMSLSLDDGGASSAKQAEARAMTRRFEEEARQIGIQIDRDIRSVLVDYRVAMETLALAEESVAAADEALRVTELKYDAGKTIVVDLLDAIAMRTRAYVGRAVAAYRARMAADRIARAVGAPVAGTDAEPLSVGWQPLHLWQPDEHTYALSVRDVAAADLVAWLIRDQSIACAADDAAIRGVRVSGVFRGHSVEQVAAAALAGSGVRVGQKEQLGGAATPLPTRPATRLPPAPATRSPRPGRLGPPRCPR